MDRLLAMETFVRVVEAGTFTKAADLLDMPKPTVTRLIQTLETHLQTKLLNRTTRRVTVTIDGAAYYDRVVRLLGEVEEIESSLSGAKTVPRGRLRIDVGAEVAHMLLIPALAEFHQRYPEHRKCCARMAGESAHRAIPTRRTEIRAAEALVAA